MLIEQISFEDCTQRCFLLFVVLIWMSKACFLVSDNVFFFSQVFYNCLNVYEIFSWHICASSLS